MEMDSSLGNAIPYNTTHWPWYPKKKSWQVDDFPHHCTGAAIELVWVILECFRKTPYWSGYVY